MTPETIGERAAGILAVRARPTATADEIGASLADVRAIRSWADAQESALVTQLSTVTAFPETTIADANRCSLGAASKTKERADTLSSTPSLADALGDGDITAGHVDAVTRATKRLDDDAQRSEFLDRADSLTAAAVDGTVDDFAKRLDREIKQMRTDDGEARLTRQRRDVRLRTWSDADGMWNLRGRFDPVTAISLHSTLTSTVDALFATQTPELCPSDPVEKNGFLAAHALLHLVGVGRLSDPADSGTAHDAVPGDAVSGGATPGDGVPGRSAGAVTPIDGADRVAAPARRPEYVAVIEADAPGPRGPQVEYPIPVELPERVVAELASESDVVGVVVRNGVVVHAPGRLDLGRSTRLANRPQRRALRALYRECAIPGCTVNFDRCKIHHLVWWRHGGTTDLSNLLPVCSHHHSKIHDAGWEVTLGPNRQLTLRLPDGTVREAGPPSRRSAA